MDLELPRNLDAEAAVLGCLAFHQEYLESLSADDFSAIENKKIYLGILELFKEGARPELPLLYERTGLPTSLLVDALAKGTDTWQMPHYLRLLHEKARERNIQHIALNALSSLQSGSPCEEIESYMIDTLSKPITKNTVNLWDGFNIDDLLDKSKLPSMVDTGIPELDCMLKGIQLTEVCDAAGRAGLGKSALGVRISINALQQAWPVLYFSFEMAEEEIRNRVLAYWADVILGKFRDRTFNFGDTMRLKQAGIDLSRVMKEFFRINTTAYTPTEMRKAIRMEQIRTKENCFVIIDHAGLMIPDKPTNNDYKDVSTISREIKRIAMQFNVPILALYQLTRAVEGRSDKRPMMSDLRGSGQIEENANSILLVYRDGYYNKALPIEQDIVTITVAKGRGGSTLGDMQVPWLSIISRPQKEMDDR